jgi:tetratricopeptide (TPR) repeat protein
MRNNFLSRFTPSLMPQEALEDIFVQRERLAARTVQQVRDSALTGPPSHTLFVGPRGIGKTHLVSLIYHRVKALPELGGRLAVAWLPEDESGIASFLDLLLAILRALGEDDPALTPRLDALYESASPEEDAKALLCELVGDRPLLLLAENLDHIFAGLRDTGQKALRAFLQESRFVTMVVTAQSLFSGVSRHSSPFYGFFRVEHLSGLSIDEAIELLVKIARRESDADLVEFLGTPAGRARIRAVDHLVSGNPRLYVIFSEFLTRDALDELVPPFLDMLDNLTPFYQAKMRALSPQQRKIVDFLSGARGAVPVKEIGRRTLIGATTAAAQLKSLRESGYVRAFRVGRESYYELREPLMRLCLEVKKQRGEPIKLFVEFLRLWCPPEELERRLAALPADAAFTRASLREALRLSSLEESPLLAACRLDYEKHLREGDKEKAQQTLEELRAIGGEVDLSPHPPVLKIVFSKAQSLWINSTTLALSGRYEEALAALEQLVKIEPEDAGGWGLRAAAQSRLGYHGRALADMDQALKLAPDNALQWQNKGVLLHNLGDYDNALRSLDQAINLDKTEPVFRLNRSVTLLALGHWKEGFTALNEALLLFQGTPEALVSATVGFVQQVITSDLNQWPTRAEALTTVYTRHGQGQALGQALVQSIPTLGSPLLSPAARHLWHETWQARTGDRAEFTLPLRLLDVAIRYQDSGDPPDARILLELPAEERSLLKPLLGVEDREEDDD